MRRAAFITGVCVLVVAGIATLTSWAHPFPLIPDGHGGYTDGNSLVFEAAPILALIASALVLFGHGTARTLAFCAGIFLLLAAYASILSNGV